jgi:7-carboxy-7-deazaguanine synthase
MLRVTEIFYSLQGETRTVGLPTAFIRLTGCPLRCSYCDTTYAFQGGKIMSLEQILSNVKAFSPRYVTVTGGEPLAQPTCFKLLKELCDCGYQVSLETGGALDIAPVDSRVIKVLDLKTPGSREVARNNYDNVSLLKQKDQVKFVICDSIDYDWAKGILQQFDLAKRCDVLFSPAHGQQSYQTLADWIIRDNLPVRFQIQLHKLIWGDQPGK